MEFDLAIYGSHDANVCIKIDDSTYRIYELERITRERYSFFSNDQNTFREQVNLIKKLIENEYSQVSTYRNCYYGDLNQEQLDILVDVFHFVKIEKMRHHLGHAAAALSTSPFNQALIISYDGGGFDGNEVVSFKIFLGNKTHGRIVELAKIPLNICDGYGRLGVPISEIRKGQYLSYAGKLMGLAGYGKIRKEWLAPVENYYYEGDLKKLGKDIDKDFNDPDILIGVHSEDLAAVGQYMFERIMYETIIGFIMTYKLPVCLTGGGALNVMFNEKLRHEIDYPVFVPPNPNDCGLSFGFLTANDLPKKQINITYNGVGLLDGGELEKYIAKYGAVKVEVDTLANIICSGKTIGVVNGNSEVGPRALGNRSIICLPNEGMKDFLNGKIKFREFYRPYGPMCREEDVNEFFLTKGYSEFMSFAPQVRHEVRSKIPSVVHVDGTSRLQTVSVNNNPFIHALLTKIRDKNSVGVVLNTSFNIKGKPILSTISEAIESWQTTALDYLYINGFLFSK